MEIGKSADDDNLDFTRFLNELIAQILPCRPNDIEKVAHIISIHGEIENCILRTDNIENLVADGREFRANRFLIDTIGRIENGTADRLAECTNEGVIESERQVALIIEANRILLAEIGDELINIDKNGIHERIRCR